MRNSNFHEDLSREGTVEGPSNRKFGFTFAIIFAVFAAVAIYRVSHWAYVLATFSIVMGLLAAGSPNALSIPNKAWLKLGLLMNRIISPIVMLILFFVVTVPIGTLMRMTGKDPLRLKRTPESKTYWLQRSDSRPLSESMGQQF